MALVAIAAGSKIPESELIARRHALAVAGSDVASTWNCTTLLDESIVKDAALGNRSVLSWSRVNCTGTTPLGPVGPMVFNILTANLVSQKLFFTPMTANTSDQLAPLNSIAAQDPRIVAGINGGYFYRTDSSSFIDNVCWGKNTSDAMKPVNPRFPNDGVGDTLVVINGEQVSSNCDCVGYNRPALAVFNGTSSYFEIQSTAAPPPRGAASCIAAGPNLLSFNHSTHAAFINIPKDDENSNILEWSSNTATAIRQQASGSNGDATTELLLVTADGYDGCPFFDPACGIDAFNFAFFLKDFVNATSAIEMDQGGSTTMFVKGRGTDGIVSCSTDPSCSYGPRPLFSAVMIGVVDD